MKILFVEDHPALRYGVTRETRAHGHTVHEAESLEHTLVLLAEHEVEVDVLANDVGLPGQSRDVFGAEARALRPDLRIMVATGMESIKVPHESIDAMMVIHKPYGWESLAAALAIAGWGRRGLSTAAR